MSQPPPNRRSLGLTQLTQNGDWLVTAGGRILKEVNPEVQFSIWVTNLGGRVTALVNRVRYAGLATLERDVDTCNAMLEHLFDHALQHSVNVTPYYQGLVDIQSGLQYVCDEIERRQASWWVKLRNLIRRIAQFFGFGQQALPPGHARRALPHGIRTGEW